MPLNMLGSAKEQSLIAKAMVTSGYCGFTFGKIIEFTKGIWSPGVYGDCRKAPKGHGDGSWFAGDIELVRGKRVLIAEDMTTTGGSLFDGYDVLIKFLGCDIAHALIVFTYNFPEMHVGAEERNLQIHAQCTFTQMLDEACVARKVGESYENVVRGWLKDPHDRDWVDETDWVLPNAA